MRGILNQITCLIFPLPTNKQRKCMPFAQKRLISRTQARTLLLVWKTLLCICGDIMKMWLRKGTTFYRSCMVGGAQVCSRKIFSTPYNVPVHKYRRTLLLHAILN